MKVPLFILGIIALLFTGCTAPLVPVTYESEIKQRSSIPAVVRLETGKITGYGSTSMAGIGNGVFIPIATGPAPNLHFDIADQKVFLDSLKSELSRHDIVKVLENTAAAQTLDIQVIFARTEHYPAMQEYKLTVVMTLTYGEQMKEHRYDILSSDGENLWTKFNTNASKGKKLAAEKLMKVMIPDIESFTLSILQAEASRAIDS